MAATRAFALDLRSRILGRPQISSDAWGPYYRAIVEAFSFDVDYARIIKRFEGQRGPQAQHRYSPGRIRAISKEAMIGRPNRDLCGTSHAERLNLSLRTEMARFARLSLAHSKKLRNHRAAVSLFVSHSNWCRVHSSIGATPAMAMELADHPWSVAELTEEVLGAEDTPERPETSSPSRGQRTGLRPIKGGLS